MTVLTAPDGRSAARQRRSFDNEIKESWIMHKRAAPATPPVPTGDAALASAKPEDPSGILGSGISGTDAKNLVMEFLRSPVTPGKPPTSSKVGKTKALEIYSALEMVQMAIDPEPLSPKAAGMFLRILKRLEGRITGEAGEGNSPGNSPGKSPGKLPGKLLGKSPGKSSRFGKRAPLPATVTPPPGDATSTMPKPTPPAGSGTKTNKDLLKAFIDTLPEKTST
ncbi:hypothetical protein PTTG_05694 [Puccinia triticina 1-1 BBBD Race 1]|uniref:Uncharacterized protein n=1 Tax=Puccinia triticina (isolate 1-1 / race 1 (BBBD)) TaxID=630390 RepID=A0A180GGF0_PUCT1|nr:hypothetical protein PTTG_05694 [Puccinia triticina 1-1 BBBD Race 1]